MISSARSSNDVGTSIPSFLAVFKFKSSWNFVGCNTGNSAGFAPLRIRPMYAPASTERNALFGTRDEIVDKLKKLEAVGVEYVLVNGSGGSRESLRRFAREIMPNFPDAKNAATTNVEFDVAAV
jgi:alkanesulfonate monooxygenase SsuD/methylene tetrahydromethanopterin reductase-like flavin-dependent oxidoreductase (luciferase family)